MKTLPLLRARADIPNQAGFVLVLVREDGSRQLSRVAVDSATGCHYCATPSGKRVDLTGKTDERSPVAGWLPYEPETAPTIPGLIADNKSPGIYTADELRGILAGWECSEPLPKRGQCLFVNFPPSSDWRLARVVLRDAKSTNGKALYTVWFYRVA